MAQAEGRLVGGRYHLEEPIGRGGMGVVWRAHDRLLDRPVAVKEVRYDSAMGDELSDLNRRTMREARAAGRLTHPNVVVVHDVIEEDDRPWIIMQLVESRSLGQTIREDGPLSPERTAEIGLQILDALRAAHAQGVLHRDVKPENVLIAEDGRVVLTDFGIARLEADSTMTRTGLVGTPAFIPPERLRGGPAQRESDLWSLGATLYAAVEGKPPHDKGMAMATMHAVLNESPAPSVRAGRLGPALMRLLAKEPADRPGYDETARLLRQVSRPPSVLPTPTLPEVIPPPASPLRGEAEEGGMPGTKQRPSGGKGGPGASSSPKPGVAASGPKPAAPAGDAAPQETASSAASAPEGPQASSMEGAHAEDSPARTAEAGAGAGAGPAGQEAARTKVVPRGGPGTRPPQDGPKKPGAPQPGAPGTGSPGVPETGVHAESPVRPPSAAAPAKAADPAGPAKAGSLAAAGDSAGPAGAAGAKSRDFGTPAPTQRRPAWHTGGPESPHTAPLQRRRPSPLVKGALVVIPALLIIAGIAGFLGMQAGERTSAQQGDAKTPPATASTATPASPHTTPSASGKPSVSSTPTPTISQPAGPPDGWHMYKDKTGFSIALPDGWSAYRRDGSNVYFRGKDGFSFLQIGMTSTPRSDAVQDWKNQENSARSRFPGYKRVRIVPVDYFKVAADWEFTWQTSSGRAHVIDRGFVTDKHHGYAIYWHTLDSRWEENVHYFDTFTATFRPAS
jgi:eukaryotic-like serine/threonine-protein kinase